MKVNKQITISPSELKRFLVEKLGHKYDFDITDIEFEVYNECKVYDSFEFNEPNFKRVKININKGDED